MLSKRLLCCSEMVGGPVACDIGTDHAWLPIYLLENGICERAYACDIAEGPLSFAKKNIAACGLEGKIETVLSDGLAMLSDESISDIIIAGMGGEMIRDILASGGEKAKAANLVLQPNTRAWELIDWLSENGFEILTQKAVADGKFVYPVINAKFSGEAKKLTQAECLAIGLDLREEISKKYLSGQIKRLRDAASGMRKGSSPNQVELEELETTASELEQLLGRQS
ncbi:MAG: class I SAM-dependent methyltransferase [Oscillospiraceae bacterium]|nr:class I SAM-dependent methyltransferase [Ruminococcus sp.]MCD8345188.1 class I SAM-dependent methyltransferase [Oscillospiraceae bacterium]